MVLAAAADLGLEGEYAREKFENDESRVYEPAKVTNFLTALTNANKVFELHRARLLGSAGPIQLWPHGFDLAFEWFGTRVVKYEEEGEMQEYPSQLNLGFYPGAEPYFYSNPWPFETDVLLGQPLPAGTRWHTDGWQGTMLPYSELVKGSDAEERLAEFAGKVYEIASPTLTG